MFLNAFHAHIGPAVPSRIIACLLCNCVINRLEIESSSIVILTHYVVKSINKGIIKKKKTERQLFAGFL